MKNNKSSNINKSAGKPSKRKTADTAPKKYNIEDAVENTGKTAKSKISRVDDKKIRTDKIRNNKAKADKTRINNPNANIAAKSKKNDRNNKFVKKTHNNNHEITGLALLAFGVLLFFSMYFEGFVGLFGSFIRTILSGLAGVTSYLLPPVVIIYSIVIIFRNIEHKIKNFIYAVLLIVLISAIIQTGVYTKEDYVNMTAMETLRNFFQYGNGFKGGGLLGGLISVPLIKIFQTFGALIILTTMSIIDIILLTNVSIKGSAKKAGNVLKKAVVDIKTRVTQQTEKEAIVTNSKSVELSELFRSNTAADNNKIIDFNLVKDIKTKAENNKNNGQKGDIGRKDKSEKISEIPEDVKITDQSAYKKNDAVVNIKKENISGQETIYRYPPFNLLKINAIQNQNTREFKIQAVENAKILEETLQSFGVSAKVINISRGPAVTRYELQPSSGVKVSKIVNLADDIALNMACSEVRIEAPIPGKAAIGIEIPNKEIVPVYLREVLESPEFKKHPSRLAFALGKNVSGECIIDDISKMPHLLIAGATGSGKSVCINSLIISLLYKSSPDEVKMLMVDPKMVELVVYNGIPHMMAPVVTDPKKAAGVLNWAVSEMVKRYGLFSQKGVRDINGFNAAALQDSESEILPRVVIVIDELSDLMMVAPNEVEDAICRLAQMARAAGMHLVIATQRPSVDVITGVIKANIPSRISFAVSSQVDSRTILDNAGAEKLLGKGDMLYYPSGYSKPVRIQGAFVDDRDVEKVVEFIKSHSTAQYMDDVIEGINSDIKPGPNENERDELLPQAIEIVIEAGQASVSMIQRKFRVGYARAARIIDQMEERGIVGRFDGSKPRSVLITKQQWNEMEMKKEF